MCYEAAEEEMKRTIIAKRQWGYDTKRYELKQSNMIGEVGPTGIPMMVTEFCIGLWLWIWWLWFRLWLWYDYDYGIELDYDYDYKYYEIDYDNDYNDESDQQHGLYGQIDIYKHHYDTGYD